uniref:Uncharacterized protein n=1 Tax=Grammatophora oceanica TaxID=210454 RepID=A0A7S1UVB0_9STRA|mmetsp:Transcript_25094/g.36751  ORF Transcript_25094/g.36751 Transcript_25094/m.36751 type:complete len:111 (+) Transcript_25094:71-403(+)|eukprot:CAMPEP_0194032526 /NCGR_PEP_ID=MMETSP0009_2-20130614/5448_1 /TAXON_ID=210454 /ORGANISM="Grammatophora oceanica, Strain CCMP 410" /LENGTH=110 /DNA_ID=CAMNT_0038672995 /DNA_START=132 /DNA_END=464 /DNA_ORIENTATION=-
MFKSTIIALVCLVASSAAFSVNTPSTTTSTTQLNAYRQSYTYKLSAMEGEESAEYKPAMFGPEGGMGGADLPEDTVPGASAGAAAPVVDVALQEFLAQFEEAAALMEANA